MAATILASAILAKADSVTNDAGGTRWPDSEKLGWLNDGAREIATTLVESSSKVANLTLVAGTKQSAPVDCITLIDVRRNMGVGGATPAEAPRRTTFESLNRHNPLWHADTATLVVKAWAYDPQTPDVLYVWPPMTSATIVEIAYAALPAAVAAVGNVISIDDQYANNLLDYILYRAFMKDAALAGMAARSKAHWEAFARSVSAGHNEAGGKAE